jgi:hypothetical protein
MVDIRYKPHHAGNTPEQRINSRTKNSGGEEAQHSHLQGNPNAPTRTWTNIHTTGNVLDHRGMKDRRGGQ